MGETWSFKCPLGGTVDVQKSTVKQDVRDHCAEALRSKYPDSICNVYDWTDTDGCSLPDWIKDKVANDELMEPACDVHDICYQTPGLTKDTCDDHFHDNMIAICDGDAICKANAWIMYTAVSEASEAQEGYDAGQKRAKDFCVKDMRYLEIIEGDWDYLDGELCCRISRPYKDDQTLAVQKTIKVDWLGTFSGRSPAYGAFDGGHESIVSNCVNTDGYGWVDFGDKVYQMKYHGDCSENRLYWDFNSDGTSTNYWSRHEEAGPYGYKTVPFLSDMMQNGYWVYGLVALVLINVTCLVYYIFAKKCGVCSRKRSAYPLYEKVSIQSD
eukprot:3236_1